MLAFGMPDTFTREEVSAIAALAHLDLTPDEIEIFARQLDAILHYAAEIQRVDTVGVPPTTSVIVGAATDRADEARPCLDIADALANAPDADRTRIEGGFFKVPKVIG